MKGDLVAVGVVAIRDVLSFLCAVFNPAGLEVAAAIEALDGCTDRGFRIGQHWCHSFTAGSCWHHVWLQVRISVVATNVFTANAQIRGPASRNGYRPPAVGVSSPPPGATASTGSSKPLCRFSQISWGTVDSVSQTHTRESELL